MSAQTHDPAKLLREHRDRIRAQIKEIQATFQDYAYLASVQGASANWELEVDLAHLGLKLEGVLKE